MGLIWKHLEDSVMLLIGLRRILRVERCFSDALLGNKYLITEDRIDDENYQYVDTFGTIHLYESQNPVQYGYIVQGNTSFC